MQSKYCELPPWCAFVLLALFAGCASTGEASRATERLALVITPCADLDISARLLDLEGDLHIHGTVRPRGSHAATSGHLDALVRTPDGMLWASVQERYRPRIRNRARGGPGQVAFDVVLDGMPPVGSVVSLEHHEGSHAEQ